ncbi:MAG: acetylglutamate kinase [Fulvivirga sp.]|nr:acetylglutamate kinase [Fulvivirga sp.]
MKTNIQVVKIGGYIINDDKLLEAFLKEFSKIEAPKILVHGGGKIATTLAGKLGVQPQFINGRRITSCEDLDIVTMVYAGLINKKIVAQLQAMGCNAIGLSGADANCLLSRKRPVQPVDFGWVGDIINVNFEHILQYLSHDITPVFCAITHDGKGQLLNTNADTVAAQISISVGNHCTTHLTYCFEKPGVLTDIDDENSVIARINWKNYQELKDSRMISEGMLPKLENCFHALKNNVSKVMVGNIGMLSKENLGTKVTWL